MLKGRKCYISVAWLKNLIALGHLAPPPSLVDQGFLWCTRALLFRDTCCHSTGGSAGFLLVVGFSFHTNLQTALDKVEGHHCGVCDAAAQDTTKATQGIILWGAKLAADILCDRRDWTQHATCRVTCNTDKNQNINPELYNGRVFKAW